MAGKLLSRRMWNLLIVARMDAVMTLSAKNADTNGDLSGLIDRLRRRAEIRRAIPHRKSAQEGKPDRIADLLDEAANAIEELLNERRVVLD